MSDGYETRIFVDGRWTAGTGPSIPIVNPSTGREVASVPSASLAQVSRAVSSAARAYPEWRGSEPADRARLLRGVADRMEADGSALAALISAEMGAPISTAVGIQVDPAVEQFREAASIVESMAMTREEGGVSVSHVGSGVVGCITPWNYPLAQVAGKVAYALAAGCSVVVKPSEVAPLSALALGRMLDEAGAPPGLVNIVTGDGPGTGESLVQRPELAIVSLTGSTRAGRRIAQLAAPHLTRVSLELGGKSASIVLDSDSLSEAVRRTTQMVLLNSGQTCAAPTRLIVPRRDLDDASALVMETMATAVMGRADDPAVTMGPLATEAQLDRVRRLVAAGRAAGAQHWSPTTPPTSAGWFHAPTLLRTEPSNVAAQEEIFGPVLSVLGHEGDDDAARIANDSSYGLSGIVWAAEDQRAWEVAARLDTGVVRINGAPLPAHVPFGGVKDSGYGREQGLEGLLEFTHTKSCVRAR